MPPVHNNADLRERVQALEFQFAHMSTQQIKLEQADERRTQSVENLTREVVALKILIAKYGGIAVGVIAVLEIALKFIGK